MGDQPTTQQSDTVGESTPSGHHLDLPDADVTFYHQFFDTAEADRLLDELCRSTGWRRETIETEDATIPLPRLTAWYGDPGRTYTYSSITMEPQPWNEPL